LACGSEVALRAPEIDVRVESPDPRDVFVKELNSGGVFYPSPRGVIFENTGFTKSVFDSMELRVAVFDFKELSSVNILKIFISNMYIYLDAGTLDSVAGKACPPKRTWMGRPAKRLPLAPSKQLQDDATSLNPADPSPLRAVLPGERSWVI